MFKLIVTIIQEYVEVDENEISESTRFIQDLHLTSYDIVSMIGQLESDLDIEIPDREIRDLETIGDLLEYIKKLI